MQLKLCVEWTTQYNSNNLDSVALATRSRKFYSCSNKPKEDIEEQQVQERHKNNLLHKKKWFSVNIFVHYISQSEIHRGKEINNQNTNLNENDEEMFVLMGISSNEDDD